MRIVMSLRTRLPIIALTLLAFTPPAWAQLGASTGQSGAGSIATGRGTAGGPVPRPPEPSALPGARSRGAVAPLTKPPSEMGPTEALFDAVNRGDAPAAREAVTRGADLNAHNILGLTALELAVDIGHNDIAFLLLSLRDADVTQATARPVKTSAAKASVAQPVVLGRATPVAAPRGPVSVATRATSPADTGAPVPSAGFLGFGGR